MASTTRFKAYGGPSRAARFGSSELKRALSNAQVADGLTTDLDVAGRPSSALEAEPGFVPGAVAQH